MESKDVKDLIGEARRDNVTILDLSSKNIISLPPEISELKKLTKLKLAKNKLISLPPEISKLKNLTELDISGNQLISLPPEISELENLTCLNLARNQLTSLPAEILDLKNLTQLNISDNKLTSLPPEILEPKLEIEWEDISKRNKILLKGNPFEYPPVEIVKRGTEAINNYFTQLETESLNEVKVLVVGEGGVGKTSLVNRLINRGCNKGESQTYGISIDKWTVESGNRKFKVNLWDFGGQEIMHATHQFFLSKRSLYILVLDSRKDEKAEYWLKNIQSFGGESPVFIVINKIDENASFNLNRKFLKEKYPSIKGFYRVSCATNEGIENFSENLRQELSNILYIQIRWPKSWLNVKKELESMKYEVICYEEYQKICDKYNIKEVSTQNTLIDFMNDLGVVIHFKDIPLLDTYILEPKWIIGAVYKIINSSELADRNGVLEYNQLNNILRTKDETDIYYSPDKYTFVIDLMKKFELCYELDENSILVPDLLKVQEPTFDFDYDTSLRFIIQYDFLPMSVMPRFIVKMNKHIISNLQWRTGVVLEDKEFSSYAVIKSDNEAKRICIYVNGKQKKSYFSVIFANFREINESFERLEVVEKIPMLDEPEVHISYRHLIKLNEMGIQRYIPDGSDFEYDVKELLEAIN